MCARRRRVSLVCSKKIDGCVLLTGIYRAHKHSQTQTPAHTPSMPPPTRHTHTPAGSRFFSTWPGLLLLLSSASFFLATPLSLSAAVTAGSGTNRSSDSKLTPKVAWSVMPNFCNGMSHMSIVCDGGSEGETSGRREGKGRRQEGEREGGFWCLTQPRWCATNNAPLCHTTTTHDKQACTTPSGTLLTHAQIPPHPSSATTPEDLGPRTATHPEPEAA